MAPPRHRARGKTVEELYTLSVGRWAVSVSKVEPGSVEYVQGANLAVTVYCDDKPFVVYAYVDGRDGEGACAGDGPPPAEEPDFVGFVLSRRDAENLEALLARVHSLIRAESRRLGEERVDDRAVPKGPWDNGEARR